MTDKLEFPFYALPKALTSRKDLQASDKVVFSVIRDYQGNNGTSWPGIRTLSQNTGLALSTVVESIRRLEAKKVLKVERQGNGKSSHYSISESVLKTSTVKKTKRTENPNTGAPKISTEAHRKSVPSKKDLLNQTHIQQFDQARKIYPGTKRGLKTEFDNFKKKHRDWTESLLLLEPAIKQQSKTIWANCEKKYIPHFQTWLNQRRWEFERSTEITIPFDTEAAAQRERMLAGIA